MVLIQIELSDAEDRTVEIFKLVNRLKTKEDAIKKMVQYFEAEITPKKIKQKDYFEA
jgi:hypothetical protein